jgi:EPS-associated MarR family transcriptional regulator
MTKSEIKIQDDTNFRIMYVLQQKSGLTQRELVNKLGMSDGGLNYCFKAFLDRDFVKMQGFQKSKSLLKHIYLLTPQDIAEKLLQTSRFLKRKVGESYALKVEIETLKAEVNENQAEEMRKRAQ